MTQKENLRILLLCSLFFLGLGGLMLHSRIHSLGTLPGNAIPFVSGVLSVSIIPLLFYYRKTVAFGYLLNGMTVIIGTIGMALFSLKNPPEIWTLQTILFKTLLADMILLWGKFAVGKALFELELASRLDQTTRRGRFFRYPNMGFWWVHLIALSMVYTLGVQIWK
ncbi:MAG: hypothetical protein ABSB79_01865 [Syntrophales bacterium]|jgi:hypothetical protein